MTEVEFRDAPSSHAVNGELAEPLDQFALPFPTQKHSLFVDNADLQIGILKIHNKFLNSEWIMEEILKSAQHTAHNQLLTIYWEYRAKNGP